jgi:hypothetical protein
MTQPTGTILTGLISIDGQPVTHCAQPCATHNCSRPCGRVEAHPQDSVACICGGCASAMVGEAI